MRVDEILVRPAVTIAPEATMRTYTSVRATKIRLTQAMRRLRRYLRMRWSLYMRFVARAPRP